MLTLLWPLSAQAYFLYQLPDGSRLITDRIHHGPNYKLVRASRDARKMGRYAARRYQRHSSKTKHFEKLIRHFANRYDVDIALVKAIVHTESYFNPDATSKVGASGLMQLMPATAERYGVTDIYDPRQNLEAGVRYLRYLLVKYGNRMRYAVAAYNAGESAVQKYNGIPPYPETQRYVHKVMDRVTYYSRWP
jgi:soluble lytic murein transglycosylase-like protein